MYQNDYLHGSPSRFSAKSAIYTATGCQHKIAIYTAAVLDPIQIYTRLPCVHIKMLFTRQPSKSQVYIHCCRMYTKTDDLHTQRIWRAPLGLLNLTNWICPSSLKCFTHDADIYEITFKSAIYIASGCIYIKLLFTRQPFKSQIADQLCDHP